MKKISFLSIVCLVFICFIFSGCSKNKKNEAETYIKSARAFMSRIKPETAVIEYRNAIQIDPKNDVALFELAEVYITLHRLNTAIRYYNLAAKANPDSIPPHLRLAQIYLQTEQLLDARAEITKVLEISPNSMNAYHLLSGIQIKERDLDSAIETLQKAAAIDDKNVKTFISLAQLYIKTKKIKNAKKAYLKAISIDSSSRDAYMGLVRLYAFEKKWDQIETLLTGILETSGIKAQKHTDLARFYVGRKKFDAAEDQYQKAVLAAPEEVFPLLNLAEYYTRRNMKDKAIVTMENALSKKKKIPLVLTGLSQIYLQFKMIDKARETVEKALERDSEFIDAILQKGRVLMAVKDFKQALNAFDKVIALDRINAKAYYYRALCIDKRGATDRPEQKIFRAAAGLLDNPEEFEKDQVKGNLLAAISIDPGLVDARIELTQIYILEKNVPKAKEQIEEIFKRRAPNLKIMALLSGIHILDGKPEEAKKILKAIIDQKPEYTPAYIRLALLYKTMGNTEKALQYFQTAYEKSPKQIGLVKLMTDIYIAKKKYDAALDLIDALPVQSAADTKSFFENIKGEIFIRKGRTDTALKHFNAAIQLYPDYINPHMHLAGLFQKQKQTAKVLEQYEIIEKIKPDYLPALLAMGFLYDSQGNYDKAEAYYRKVLKISPRHPNAANNLAFILCEKPDRLEEAFRLSKIAREKSPKDPNVLDTMGWVYYQKGNYLNALSELKDSLTLNPTSALACYHYGMTLYRTKDYEKARKYFKMALKINPEFNGAQTAIKMLN